MIHLVEAECRNCGHEQDFRVRMPADWTDQEMRQMLRMAPSCDDCLDTAWRPMRITDSTPQEALS